MEFKTRITTNIDIDAASVLKRKAQDREGNKLVNELLKEFVRNCLEGDGAILREYMTEYEPSPVRKKVMFHIDVETLKNVYGKFTLSSLISFLIIRNERTYPKEEPKRKAVKGVLSQPTQKQEEKDAEKKEGFDFPFKFKD